MISCLSHKHYPLFVISFLWSNLANHTANKFYQAFIPFLDQNQISYKDIPYAADEYGIPAEGSYHEAFQEKGNEMERLVDTVKEFVIIQMEKLER